MAGAEKTLPDSELGWAAARGIEVTKEGDGCWRPCSGCQESVDGCVSTKDYPFSAIFGCQPGGGCGECGGIGVIWDRTDYAEMAEWTIRRDKDHENVKRILTEEGGLPPFQAEALTLSLLDLETPSTATARGLDAS